MTDADKPGRSAAQDYSIGVAIALVVCAALAVTWLVRSGGNSTETADGLEPQIAEHFGQIAQTTITVDCPDGVKTRKDKISDCTATRADNGRTPPTSDALLTRGRTS